MNKKQLATITYSEFNGLIKKPLNNVASISAKNGLSLRSSLGLFMLLIAAPVAAETDLDELLDMSLDELVQLETTIASGKSASIFKSISTVSVITKEDINRYNFRTVADAIQTIAGFDIYRTYFKNQIPTARGILQDHYANKVLLMINNVPTWHAITGEANVDRVNIHDVEKIEVLKGPASVLYGSNAYSGAVNIVLKKPQQSENSLYASAGNHEQYGAGGSMSRVNEKGDASIFVSVNGEHSDRQSVDFADETGVDSDFDDYLDTQNVNISGQYKSHKLLINLYNNTEAYMGIIPRNDFGIGEGHDVRGYLLGYQYEYDFDNAGQLSFSSSYDWNEREFLRSESAGTRGEATGYRFSGQLKYYQRFDQHFYFDTGVDYETRESDDYRNYIEDTGETITHNNMKGKSVWEYSAFASVGYENNDWTWNIGLRNTENELFDNQLSGRVTLVRSLSATSSVKFIASESYRSPSLFELYFIPPEETVFGNTDLSPEKSRSYEMAFLKSFGRVFTQANIYYASYSNKIQRIQTDVTTVDGRTILDTFLYKNGDDFDVAGLELEAHHRSETWSSFTNFNYQHGNDGDEVPGTDHYNFKYVPSYTVAFGLSKIINNITLSSVLNFRDSTKGTTDKDIASSVTLDLAASYSHQWTKGYQLKHILRLANVTDEQVDNADYARRRGLEAVPNTVGSLVSYELSLDF